ncbi:MAG: hypothetical protein ACFE0J_11175 [Elainellaceae cyanobacterium]
MSIHPDGHNIEVVCHPDSEGWDAAMLVEQSSPAAFMAFASNREYLVGMGHRTAALEDSRLLPLEDIDWRAQS